MRTSDVPGLLLAVWRDRDPLAPHAVRESPSERHWGWSHYVGSVEEVSIHLGLLTLESSPIQIAARQAADAVREINLDQVVRVETPPVYTQNDTEFATAMQGFLDRVHPDLAQVLRTDYHYHIRIEVLRQLENEEESLITLYLLNQILERAFSSWRGGWSLDLRPC